MFCRYLDFSRTTPRIISTAPGQTVEVKSSSFSQRFRGYLTSDQSWVILKSKGMKSIIMLFVYELQAVGDCKYIQLFYMFIHLVVDISRYYICDVL